MVIGPYLQDAHILEEKTNRKYLYAAHAMTRIIKECHGSSEAGHGEGELQETRKRRKQTLRCED